MEGTEDDFVFTGTDGNVYELSENFRENDSYYWIINGEHVPAEYYFYNHIHSTLLNQMTGITASDRWNAEWKGG